MANVTTSIPQYWHDIASRKGIKWSVALIVGIRSLIHQPLDGFDVKSSREVNDKLRSKIKELHDVLEKKGIKY